MDLIQSEKLIIDELIEIFSEQAFQKQFETTAESIKIIFKVLLDDNGEAFDLISKNSVRDIKFYSIVHRIKEPDSMREKFYRSNLLNTEFRDLTIKNRPDAKRKKNIIKQRFRNCDDIIGIKILTDLNQDCKKILSLLKDNESYLIAENVKLDRQDLLKQPTKMKNGLEIYKISGTFNSESKFELQIKSKILSAWGDMEHSIFYKDYFISPVRESTQATMNHIGRLLFQIDDFLSSVRNTNKTYEKKAEVTSFLSWLDKHYSKLISDKLGGIGFNIDSISEMLFYVKNSMHISKNIKRHLQFDHFKYSSKIKRNQQYIYIRNSSFDLKILEAILLSWLWPPSKINISSWDSRLNYYLDIIINYLSDALLNHFEGYGQREIIYRIKSYIDKIILYRPNSNLFLAAKVYIKHIEFINFIKSELELRYPSSFNHYVKYLQDIDFMILNYKFKGEWKKQLSDFNYKGSDLESMNEILQHFTIQIKVRGKYEFEDEVDCISNVIQILNER
jgi:ppGpp synthetase/RelA/SpoT-type nucleotidyltranferase